MFTNIRYVVRPSATEEGAFAIDKMYVDKKGHVEYGLPYGPYPTYEAAMTARRRLVSNRGNK